MTAILGRLVLKIKYLGMPSILLQREVMKELLQEDATVNNLAAELNRLRSDPVCVLQAAAAAAELKYILSTPTRRNAWEWASQGLKE